MADIRCPNCGKNNPDFLDYCQFCQTPLKPESTVRMGDKPVKKNTGELEPVLPEWLRDVRQQARDSAEEDQVQSSSMRKVKKEEPPDLLAGLAFQSQNADDEDVPDWLSNLSGAPKKEKPATSEPANDFFAQFEKSQPAAKEEPAQAEETPSWSSGQSQTSAEPDELSAWFAKASEEPEEPLPEQPDLSQIDSGWGIQNDSSPIREQPAPKEQEDLSWLRNLEDEAKKTGELSAPKQDRDWFAEFGAPAESTPASSGAEDLSWLNNLGALPASETPAQPSAESGDDLGWLNNFDSTPAPQQPASRAEKEDLSWLDNLGGTSVPSEPAKPASEPKEDLSWLSNFDATPAEPLSAQPKEDLSWLNAFDQIQPAQPTPATPASKEDLSWLNNFASTPAPEQPSTQSQDDLSWLTAFGQSQPAEPASTAASEDLGWLNELQGKSENQEPPKRADQPEEMPHLSPFTPRKTAPLSPEDESSVPDWLRSATEVPSMPVNAGQLDQFREDFVPAGPDEPFSWKNFVPEAKMDEEPAQTKPEPAFTDADIFSTANEATLSNQEVDSLFSEMPDWLSRPATVEEPKQQAPQEDIGIHAEGGEALAPVDLPSWVQAMRPVEAAISETPSIDDQPTEREGPLAGFKGVLPAVPIGSSRRPQPIALKLQASAEQQASAAIMEQILASETSPRQLLAAPTFSSQRMLRIGLAVLVWLVLGAIILLRTQIMPISAVLPPDVDAVSQTLQLIPDNSSILVVMDYEPSLAGEMEATSSPVLNQLVLLKHPQLSFISTSPNGPGLVERLLRNTNISTPGGSNYQEQQNYFNLGYLPGGEAGILSFIQSSEIPNQAANAGGFSQYSAVVMLTDHSDSARSWIEQLSALKQSNPALANQPLLVISSAQVGPMLQPYVSSKQVNGLINGLADSARYEFRNGLPNPMARPYWDAFGSGIILAVILIVLGSLWSLIANIRARRAEAGEA